MFVPIDGTDQAIEWPHPQRRRCAVTMEGLGGGCPPVLVCHLPPGHHGFHEAHGNIEFWPGDTPHPTTTDGARGGEPTSEGAAPQ